jgi:hypothetical protein
MKHLCSDARLSIHITLSKDSMLQRVTSYQILYCNKTAVKILSVRSCKTQILLSHKFSGYHDGCYLNAGLLCFDVM